MKIDDKIIDEKIQYNIGRELAKILSSVKIDKHEYLPGEEILPSNQNRIIEKVKFTYYPVGKALKNNWGQWKKQIKALKEHRKHLAVKKNL